MPLLIIEQINEVKSMLSLLARVSVAWGCHPGGKFLFLPRRSDLLVMLILHDLVDLFLVERILLETCGFFLNDQSRVKFGVLSVVSNVPNDVSV